MTATELLMNCRSTALKKNSYQTWNTRDYCHPTGEPRMVNTKNSVEKMAHSPNVLRRGERIRHHDKGRNRRDIAFLKYVSLSPLVIIIINILWISMRRKR